MLRCRLFLWIIGFCIALVAIFSIFTSDSFANSHIASKLGLLETVLQRINTSSFKNNTDVVQLADGQVDERFTCGTELMSMPMYKNGKLITYGKKFSCNLLRYLNETQLLGTSNDETKNFTTEDVVYVTYSSENHFDESKQAILRLRNISMNKIIYYDVGLNEEQVAEVKRVCNLEYREFKFSHYPYFVRDLSTYSFKSIVVAEVYNEYPVFWYMDASTHFGDAAILQSFYKNASVGKYGKFIGSCATGHSIFAATAAGMYDYLPLDEELKIQTMFGAWMLIVRSPFSREAVKWNFLCALTEGCMRPAGSKQHCAFDGDSYKKYANCHRYDQSAINIILYNLFEKYNSTRPVEGGDFANLFNVRRGAVYKEPLNLECKDT